MRAKIEFRPENVPAGGTSAASSQEREIRHIFVLRAALDKLSNLPVCTTYMIGWVVAR
jgi:hypothetical protein